MLNKILANPSGRFIISFILGLGLASLFKKVCVDDNCLIIKTDPKWNLDKKTFQKNNGKCFKFKPQETKCLA